jgi:hypothetical protein
VEGDGTWKMHLGNWVLCVIGCSSLAQDVTNNVVTACHSFRPIGYLLTPEETIEGFYELGYGVKAGAGVLFPGCVMNVDIIVSDRSDAVRCGGASPERESSILSPCSSCLTWYVFLRIDTCLSGTAGRIADRIKLSSLIADCQPVREVPSRII